MVLQNGVFYSDVLRQDARRSVSARRRERRYRFANASTLVPYG